jgi:hypothetical protein
MLRNIPAPTRSKRSLEVPKNLKKHSGARPSPIRSELGIRRLRSILEHQAPQHGPQKAAPPKSVLAEKSALLRVTARARTRVFGTRRDVPGTGRNKASYRASPKISTHKRGKKRRASSRRKPPSILDCSTYKLKTCGSTNAEHQSPQLAGRPSAHSRGSARESTKIRPWLISLQGSRESAVQLSRQLHKSLDK